MSTALPCGRFQGDYYFFKTRWNWTQFENGCGEGKVSDILKLFRGNVGYQRKLKVANSDKGRVSVEGR